eukprot:12362943-Heterocapsa_arctica.AAC.1
MIARASAFRCAATSPMLWKKKLFRDELIESEEALMGLRLRLDDWFSRSSSAYLIRVREIICAMPNAILAVNEAPPKLIVKTLYRELCAATQLLPLGLLRSGLPTGNCMRMARRVGQCSLLSCCVLRKLLAF